MRDIVRRPTGGIQQAISDPSLEWLVTNGLGGYAFGTVSGVITRSYHGYLISALPTPLGRLMMLSDVIEHVHFPDGSVAQLNGDERPGLPFDIRGADCLIDFYLDNGLPVWQYQVNDALIEKRIVMPHRQNTVLMSYCLISDTPNLRLSLRPSVHFRPHNGVVTAPSEFAYTLVVAGDHYEISQGDLPPLRFRFIGPKGVLVVDRIRIHEILYRLEEQLGYPARGALWSPGHFDADFTSGTDIVLTASTENWEVLEALTASEAISAEQDRRERLLHEATRSFRRASRNRRRSLDRTARELILAADQFLVVPAGRMHHQARARAAGDELCSIIAGYPWFTDWGRDTMISLEGLTLTTGRYTEASWILKTFAHSVEHGLIPNLFPERQREGLYHTADATLWFFHAIARYVEVTEDHSLLRSLLPKLEEIIEHHLHGTLFGIGVDPADGLLREGDPSLPLTWMDAKKDDWVVTPRRGKPVEINALWYNALRHLEKWLHDAGRQDSASKIAEHAEKARVSFGHRFWYADGDYLYDVVDGPDGDDPACRPNQLLSISLVHPILDHSFWPRIVDICKEELITPYGLRSLSPNDPEFKPTYDGDLLKRDAAYHQGTAWTWLIGPFIDAWLKTYPNRKHEAHRFLEQFNSHFGEAGLGTISEIFDAQSPFTARGCVAQAWSVAEVLRCWALTSGSGAVRDGRGDFSQHSK